MLQSALVLAASMLSFLVLFLILYQTHRWNRRRFTRSKIHVQTYTLSQRFQLSENIRSVTLIIQSGFLAVLGGIFVAFQILVAVLFSDQIPNNKSAVEKLEPQLVRVYVIKRKITDGKVNERELYFEMLNQAWR
ncbi:unnamed protein product [Bursaphelenchus okinawaensis]|uniref:Uncharacterized protein n=1 Tax=Bursaphelenchus okinawaensis TaxID=465554 RepID=A0A811KBB3_9BILA|nr:unnamed protein product [Bursaphelenchus okinawaensis]CAG9098863.1 unnamed protein product [Bursaphelenchus okinawaensis]